MAEQGNGLSIKAAAAWFPPDRETAPDGLGPADLERIGVTELPVANGLAAPEMAVLAAREAIGASGVEPGAVGHLLHSNLYHQGFDIWSPAHYIAQESGAVAALPVNVQQTCNGAAVALHLASVLLTAAPDSTAALVTAADRFCGPGFDRWRSDDEAVYGDSGVAVVLGRSGGGNDLLDLLALELGADPAFEIQMRGDDGFGPAPLHHGAPIDLVRPNNVFRASGQAAQLGKAGVEKLFGAAQRAMAKAGVTPEGIHRVAIPRLTRHMRENVFKPAIGMLLGRPPEFLEHDTGCLGPGEYLASLAEMAGALEPGEAGLVIQGGGGFTFSCTIVRRSVN
ncbi:ketoacyl-ACP synthase III family protein [Streptomyces sp. NPDC089799]|uniref:ketoacyl-ACP synthase III family protein n=1 Tax=Streptomyces sp. NPDC089799 TaxID=3155066 RepID=UPI0034324C5B